jgi:hypothetical protein
MEIVWEVSRKGAKAQRIIKINHDGTTSTTKKGDGVSLDHRIVVTVVPLR